MTETWDILKIRYYAAEGNAAAQRELGIRFAEGNGVSQDDAEAVRWFQLAARQGDVDAQYRLGLCYVSGIGVAKDPGTAQKWFRRASRRGHTGAASMLRARYQAIGTWTGFMLSVFVGILGYHLTGSTLTAMIVFIVCVLSVCHFMKS